MQSTRREFLGYSLAGLSYVSLSQLPSRLLAQAAAESALADQNDHVLVLVELNGGNDGLNTIIPFEDPLYYKLRPSLAISKEAGLKLNDQLRWHPALGPLAKMFDAGQVAIAQGVGYPEPDRSHFRSMEIWHTASTNKIVPSSGWLGKFLDQLPVPGNEVPLSGLALTGTLPQALQAEKVVAPVVSQLDTFASQAESKDLASKLRRKLSTSGGGELQPVDFVRQQSAAVYRAADKLNAATSKYKSSVEYFNNDLANQLKRAAQILSGRLGVRILTVSHGGYDTHSAQADSHQNLLNELATSLASFQQDLAGLGLADKVVVLVYSEFGRRADENASAGTDHGAANCLFVQGAPVKGGVVGQHPSLEKLGDGDMIFHTDFRQIYATLLEGWLGCPAKQVLTGEFPKLPLLKA
ncbi:MAG: hypothetical protein JWM11_6065 [Planctomycetaceae bacterium]|nr:hypothetical protein [Planctomycetaceae bacterium]